MKVIVETYIPEKKEVWNEFISESNNGTIFHNLDFLDYHGEKFRETENHLMFYRGKKLLAVMPLAEFKINNRITARSPYGGSFGGIVIKLLTPFRHCREIVVELKKYLVERGVSECVITPPPMMYSRVPTCYLEFNLLKNGFSLINRDITSVIDLKTVDGKPPTFQSRVRWSTKKARNAGILVKDSKDYEAFFPILSETKRKHGVESTHTLDELNTIARICPESIKLYLAYKEREAIAGIMYIACNPQTILSFYICQKNEYKEFQATSLLLDAGIKNAFKWGYRFLDLGTSTHNMQNNNNLLMFKEGFKSSGYFRDTFRWKDGVD